MPINAKFAFIGNSLTMFNIGSDKVVQKLCKKLLGKPGKNLVAMMEEGALPDKHISPGFRGYFYNTELF